MVFSTYRGRTEGSAGDSVGVKEAPATGLLHVQVLPNLSPPSLEFSCRFECCKASCFVSSFLPKKKSSPIQVIKEIIPCSTLSFAGLTLRSEDISAAAEAWPVGLFGLVSILLFTPNLSRIILQLHLQPQEFVTGVALFC
ncbi:hypothetical protein L1987_39439 [Smallanthus sonchifolius]|uniref:Uncharacterized protein n=1 Tax=Smallanthus sonchifolius TaxID=185202 RepID=A0ACB9HM15_9ASTR|nr:hypothetical protein L1987_39439 [Smallanthus sonchifolius]